MRTSLASRFSPRTRVSCCLATLLLGCASAHAAPTQFQSLIASGNPSLWYKFNEQPGATAIINYGSLGTIFNGSFPSGVTFGASTLGGDSGIQFSSPAHQYIESLAPAPTAFTGNPTFTAETLVFVVDNSSTAIYPPFLQWGAPAIGQSVYFSLQRSTSDRYFVGFYGGGLQTTCSFYRPGRWHHIVWTRQGDSTQYQGTHLYVDGDEIGLQPDSSLAGAPTINITSTTFRIQRATDGERYFSGSMDELVLYPRVLSADEVRAHYAALGPTATPPCRADFNADCTVDFFDYLDFVQALTDNTPNADFNIDGAIDFFDYLDFIQAFSTGC